MSSLLLFLLLSIAPSRTTTDTDSVVVRRIADRILVKDFSRDFTNDETVSNRTLAEKAEKWLQENDINKPF